jgi:DNA-binding beta-propeller fold protein YncE
LGGVQQSYLGETPMQTQRRFLLLFLVFSFAVLALPVFAQQVIATVPVGVQLQSSAVNPVTNKIYVVNTCGTGCQGDTSPIGTVTVVDGATLTTATVAVDRGPRGIAVNPVTNKVYIANYCGSDPNCGSIGTVTVIDGITNNTLSVNVGYNPVSIAVNTATNKIYVVNQCGYDPSLCGTPNGVRDRHRRRDSGHQQRSRRELALRRSSQLSYQ